MAWSNPRRRLPGVVAGYETKDATAFRDELRERPAPDLSCPECPNEDVRVGESGRRGECPAVVRLPRLWVRSPSRIVYGAER